MTRLKNKYSHLTNNSISKHAEDSIREKAAVVGVSISISSPFREGVILPYPFASGGRSQEVLQSRTRASVGKEAWDSQCCLGQLLVIFLSPTESSLLFCVRCVFLWLPAQKRCSHMFFFRPPDQGFEEEKEETMWHSEEPRTQCSSKFASGASVPPLLLSKGRDQGQGA